MKFNLKKTLIWSSIAVAVVGIGVYLKHQIDLASKLVYDFKNLKLKKVTPTEVSIEFNLEVDNPTKLIITSKKVNMNVYANGVYVTNIYSGVPKVIRPFSKSYIPLKMSLNPKELLQNTTQILQGSANLNPMVLTFKGHLVVQKYGLPVPIPFIYTTTYGELMGTSSN